MSLITYQKFAIVPKQLEEEFAQRVVHNYCETIQLRKSLITTEINIMDEMIEEFSQLMSLEIFEDRHQYTKYAEGTEMLNWFEQAATDHFEEFIHDIVLVFEQNKMFYQLDYDTSLHHCPTQGVW